MIVDNHPSVLQRSESVDKYFSIEVCKHAMVGPLQEIPLKKLHVSPTHGSGQARWRC